MATALGQSEMVVKALQMGANDYVTKPYDLAVLLARVQTQLALKRMVEEKTLLERRLAERNAELEKANRHMKADLEAAAQVQEALLPPADTSIPGLKLAWSFRPCEHLAGDTLNVFTLDRDHVGLYLLDVSGHGVPAALLSVHLSLILSPARDHSSFLVRGGRPMSPAQVVGTLNRRFAQLNTEKFFTLFYGVLNRRDGALDYACAGHPGPVVVSNAGEGRILPPSGPPVGVMDSDYEEHRIQLMSGDRLYLYSDGVTEAARPDGQMFGAEQLTALLMENRGIGLEDSLSTLMAGLDAWNGGRAKDDISVLAVEFCGTAS
jgi:sigma-B regulation protein RsbU (phosphoserine phosphatase)